MADIIEKEELHNPYHEGHLVFSCQGDNKSCKGALRFEVKESRLGDKEAIKNMDQILGLIRKVSFFQELSPYELRQVFPLLSYRKVTPGSVILRKGDLPKKIYIIISGKVEVHDGENIIAHLGKGEIFGEMSHLHQKNVSATVTVRETGWIIEIDGENFQLLLKRYPVAQMFLVRLLSKRLARTTVDRTSEFEAGMAGQLSQMSPVELFQMFNNSQKTGSLILKLPQGDANLKFKDGELLSVHYGKFANKDAFFEILKEKDGRFKFVSGLGINWDDTEAIGDFMGLLLEGLRRLDEENLSCD